MRVVRTTSRVSVEGTKHNSSLLLRLEVTVHPQALVERFPRDPTARVVRRRLDERLVCKAKRSTLAQKPFPELVALGFGVDAEHNGQNEVENEIDPNDDENKEEDKARLTLRVRW